MNLKECLVREDYGARGSMKPQSPVVMKDSHATDLAASGWMRGLPRDKAE